MTPFFPRISKSVDRKRHFWIDNSRPLPVSQYTIKYYPNGYFILCTVFGYTRSCAIRCLTRHELIFFSTITSSSSPSHSHGSDILTIGVPPLFRFATNGLTRDRPSHNLSLPTMPTFPTRKTMSFLRKAHAAPVYHHDDDDDTVSRAYSASVASTSRRSHGGSDKRLGRRRRRRPFLKSRFLEQDDNHDDDPQQQQQQQQRNDNNKRDDESVYSNATTVKAGTCHRPKPRKTHPPPTLTIVSEPTYTNNKPFWRFASFRKKAPRQSGGGGGGKYESNISAQLLEQADHYVAQRGGPKKKEVPYTMKRYILQQQQYQQQQQQQQQQYQRFRSDSTCSTNSTASSLYGRFVEI